MDANYFRSYIEMDILFTNKEFEKCERILTGLIHTDPSLTDEEKKINICLLKKRIIINYNLKKYEVVLKDIETLKLLNVVFDSKDEIFYIHQEVMLSLTIDTVIDNLETDRIHEDILSERTKPLENSSSIELTIESLKEINPKQIFKRSLLGGPQQMRKRRRNYTNF